MKVSLRTVGELRSGDTFSCRIQGVAVTGTVSIHGKYIYLCQNKKNGNNTVAEKYGHKYAWAIPFTLKSNTLEPLMAKQAVTDFQVNRTTAKTTKVATPKKALKKAAVKYKEATESITNIDADISTAERRLAELKAKKALKEAEADPTNVLGYRVQQQSGGKFQIGCGEVTVTREEAAKFAIVATSIMLRCNPTNAYDRFREAIMAARRLGRVKLAANILPSIEFRKV